MFFRSVLKAVSVPFFCYLPQVQELKTTNHPNAGSSLSCIKHFLLLKNLPNWIANSVLQLPQTQLHSFTLQPMLLLGLMVTQNSLYALLPVIKARNGGAILYFFSFNNNNNLINHQFVQMLLNYNSNWFPLLILTTSSLLTCRMYYWNGYHVPPDMTQGEYSIIFVTFF